MGSPVEASGSDDTPDTPGSSPDEVGDGDDGDDDARRRLSEFQVFLDFDRTIASTRGGGSPMKVWDRATTYQCGGTPCDGGRCFASASVLFGSRFTRSSSSYSSSSSGLRARGLSSSSLSSSSSSSRVAVAQPQRGGAEHSIDGDLRDLLRAHPAPRCAIVTRNSFRDDIRAFLRRHGVPDGVAIHTVKKGELKAAVICAALADAAAGTPPLPPSKSESPSAAAASPPPPPSAPGHRPEVSVLFADDSIEELLTPALCAERRILRVLFTRAR